MKTHLVLPLLLLSATGCSYQVNPQLAHYDPAVGYRYWDGNDEQPDERERTFVALTFSGGGTRAAAFAYGALDALEKTDIGPNETMLDEVDVISSVSGGSFAAAHLALFGKETFFQRFPETFLDLHVHCGLIGRILAPWNWPALLSPNFGRSDLAAEYYDEKVFEGRTFADMPQRPFVVLNATDIARGAQFSFTQDHFDRLCSDVSKVEVARAVTASSAFPVAFTPLTVKNYDKQSCEYVRPGWMEGAELDADIAPQRYDLFRTWASYENAEERPYIHLSDGGLTDNLGLRAVETALFETDSWGILGKVSRGEVKHLVIIVVDAKPRAVQTIDRSACPPGIYTVLNASGTNPMENYSSDTVERIRAGFKEWDRAYDDYQQRRRSCAKLAEESCEQDRARQSCTTQMRERCERDLNATPRREPPHPTLHLIHLRFDAIPDVQARRDLENIDTSLQLSEEQVAQLEHWGRKLLADSDEYRALIDLLRSEAGN